MSKIRVERLEDLNGDNGINVSDLSKSSEGGLRILKPSSTFPIKRDNDTDLQVGDVITNLTDGFEYKYTGTGWLSTDISKLSQDMASKTDPNSGAALLGRGVVSLESISDLASAKRDSSLRYLVRGWHLGNNLGGDEFRWDSSILRSTHNGGTIISPTVPVVTSQSGASISEKTSNFLSGVGESDSSAAGCFIRISGFVTPEQFGAFNGVETIVVTATGNQVIKSNGSFTSADVGKKIQIFKGGSSNTSHASFISSVSNGTATLRTPVSTNVSNVPAHVGFCSYYQVRKMVDYIETKGISICTASGEYLLASDNGNITLGQQINLSADNIDWDFKGSRFYGMLLLVRLTSGTVYSVKNSHLHGHKVFCLGDGLDALSGNTNWNGVAAAAIDSSIYDFTVNVIGGVRAISLQTSSVFAPIRNVIIRDFTVIADSTYGSTCEALDISMSLPDLINGVEVFQGKTYNFGKIIGVSNSTLNLTNKNVFIRDIEAFGSCLKCGNINRTDGFTLRNVIIHDFTSEAFIINSCDNGTIVGLDVTCSGTSLSALNIFDSRTIKSGNSNIKVSGFKSKSLNIPFTQGTVIHSANGVHITDSDICDGVIGAYDNGFSGKFDNIRFSRNTKNIRPVSGSLLSFVDCFDIGDAIKPALVDESGSTLNAFVLFDGTGVDGAQMVIRRSHNVLSVVRISLGIYEITMIRAGAGYPMVAGAGRQFGGNYGTIGYGAIPAPNSITVRVALTAGNTLVQSDYVSVFIR